MAGGRVFMAIVYQRGTGMAERVGFEPTEGLPSTVFKTVAFDRSATSPVIKPAVGGRIT